jgi:hypothetical protein
MKTKIKLLSILTTVTICSTLLISSCQKTANQDLSEKAMLKSQMEEKYKVVGENHNQSLDSAFAILSSQKIITSSKQQCVNQFEKAINSGLAKLNYSVSYCEATNAGVFKSVLSSGMQKSASKIVNDSLCNDSNISADLKSLITQLIETSDSTDWSTKKFNAYVDSLNNVAVNILSEKELNIFFPASSVAKNSFAYWKNNLDKWIALFNAVRNNSKQKTNSIQKVKNPYTSKLLKGMVACDVGGAVGGAIAGAITGPGMAVSAAVVSASASTAKFVENAWNSLF